MKAAGGSGCEPPRLSTAQVYPRLRRTIRVSTRAEGNEAERGVWKYGLLPESAPDRGML